MENEKIVYQDDSVTHYDCGDYLRVIIDDENPYRCRHYIVPKDHVPMKKCKWCGTDIWFMKTDEGKWLAMKPRNGVHRCKKR